jgi:hypothetical protein
MHLCVLRVSGGALPEMSTVKQSTKLSKIWAAWLTNWDAGHREACAEISSTPLQPWQKVIPVHHSSSAAPALPRPTEDTEDSKRGSSALEGAVSSKVSSAVAGSGESPAMDQAGRGGEQERAVPRDGAKRDAQVPSGARDRPGKQEIVPKEDPCNMPRKLSRDPHFIGDNLLFKISGDPHLLKTPDSALDGGTGLSAQKGNSARIKGFSLTSPPPGFDDPDPVCALDFAEEYQLPKPHCRDEQAVSKRGARGGVTKAGPSGYDDPDLVPSSPHPPAEARARSTAAAARAAAEESGYDDPDLVISRPSGGAANARVACGDAQTPTPTTARYDAQLGPPDEYRGARADALPMVEEASTVLESHFCKLAETLAHERAALEKDRAAHRSLQQALRSTQVSAVCVCGLEGAWWSRWQRWSECVRFRPTRIQPLKMGGTVDSSLQLFSRVHTSLLTISSGILPPALPPNPLPLFLPLLLLLSSSSPYCRVHVSCAAHARLHRTLFPSQARLVQVRRERDEAEAAAAQQAEEKTAISQRVALLEAAIRTS